MSGDKLRDTISRLSILIDLPLVETFDKSRNNSGQDPEQEHRKEIQEHRAALPNRITKKAFDRELKKKKSHREKESKRNRKNDIRRLKKLQRQLDDQYPTGAIPVLIPSNLYKAVKHIVSDSTGGAAVLYASMCPHKIAITNIRRTALCIGKDGVAKYSFSGADRGAVRARYIMALGYLLIGLSKRTGRKGDKWNRIVKGLSQSRLIDTISHPAKEAKSVSYSAFNGTHNRDLEEDCTDGNVGYLRALKNGGLCYTRQCHWLVGQKTESRGWDDMTPNEIAPVTIDGKDGAKYNVSYCRYWILTDEYTSPKDAAVRAQLWADWHGGNLPAPSQQAIDRPRSRPEKLSTVISPAPS